MRAFAFPLSTRPAWLAPHSCSFSNRHPALHISGCFPRRDRARPILRSRVLLLANCLSDDALSMHVCPFRAPRAFIQVRSDHSITPFAIIRCSGRPFASNGSGKSTGSCRTQMSTFCGRRLYGMNRRFQGRGYGTRLWGICGKPDPVHEHVFLVYASVRRSDSGKITHIRMDRRRSPACGNSLIWCSQDFRPSKAHLSIRVSPHLGGTA